VFVCASDKRKCDLISFCGESVAFFQIFVTLIEKSSRMCSIHPMISSS
jgi:hypothetical protein